MGAVTADGNNHIFSPSWYDASGNTLNDGNYSYTWDGESQMETAVVSGVTYTYAYDGDGRRVAKVGSKLYWYGSGGEILAETDASGNLQNEYIFFGGRRVAVAPASGSALYYAEDMLGSSRVMVQSNGTPCYDADFTPFGGERAYTNTCPQNYKFEGKERDTETQNDDFGARYYSWRFGRWLSADWSSVPVAVPYANLTNPQTLNLYSMVADDPESFADLDGHWVTPGAYGQEICQTDPNCVARTNQNTTNAAQAPAQNPPPAQNNEPVLMAQNQMPAPQQPPAHMNAAEERMSAAVAYSENTHGTLAEHEAIVSVIVNRAESGQHQYVAPNQAVNVTNVINAPRQFQGVGGNNYNTFGNQQNQGSQNARQAAATVARNGPTNRATAFIAQRRAPTARQVRALGHVQPAGHVGDVWLYEPRHP